jgi:tetratricopeptide (TPR) repeat protein
MARGIGKHTPIIAAKKPLLLFLLKQDRSGSRHLTAANNLPSGRFTTRGALRAFSPQLSIIILVAVGVLIYLPGLSGPYLFDDHGNLIANSYIQLEQLTWGDLYRAAFSLDSGPLRRPFSVLSFALNYWFAGGFENSAAFKGINLAIHLANGILVFILTRLLLARAAIHAPGADRPETIMRRMLPGLIALIWTAHPIQLTSVLYVVQRMTSLAAFFTLAALCAYLLGRQQLAAGKRRNGWLLMFGAGLLATLGVFSKETAVLFPLYVIVVELVFFRDSIPGYLRQRFGRRLLPITIVTAAALTVTIIWAIDYIEPRYSHLTFTMGERALTQFRVLFFYLSLILLPNLGRLGLHHDDLALSTSWLTPWTTLPSFAGILLMLGAALALRRRDPLISLGVLWFLAGHSLESTILPLEIAHEHRNYLPSLGIVLALLHALTHPRLAISRPRAAAALTWVIPVFILSAAATTAIRAAQWSELRTLSVYEVLHHPLSARSHATLGSMLASAGQPGAAIEAMQQAATLDPQESGYLLLAMQIAAPHDIALPDAIHADLHQRLGRRTPSTLTRTVMGEITNCLPHGCRRLAEPMIGWANILIGATPQDNYGLQSYWYYIRGRVLAIQERPAEAVASLERSHELDPHYLHPLFEILRLHIAAGDRVGAEKTLIQLMHANEKAPHPRNRELLKASQHVYAMREAQGAEKHLGIELAPYIHE